MVGSDTSLQALKIRELLHHPSYESKVLLGDRAKWIWKGWVNHLKDHIGSPIHLPPPEMIYRIGCFQHRLGAQWNNQKTGGQWSASESRLHINAKELLAAFLFLHTFAKDKTGIHVHLKMDNLTADGWYSFQGVDGNYCLSMAMEHTEEHNDLSRAPTRQTEHNGRPGVLIEGRQLRVDAKSSSV